MSYINGAYSVERPDDIIEPYARNGFRGIESSPSGLSRSLDLIPSGPFKDRVLDAISMIKDGMTRIDVQDKHGAIVYRQAKRFAVEETRCTH